jgi:hypothetical protein
VKPRIPICIIGSPLSLFLSVYLSVSILVSHSPLHDHLLFFLSLSLHLYYWFSSLFLSVCLSLSPFLSVCLSLSILVSHSPLLLLSLPPVTMFMYGDPLNISICLSAPAMVICVPHRQTDRSGTDHVKKLCQSLIGIKIKFYTRFWLAAIAQG